MHTTFWHDHFCVALFAPKCAVLKKSSAQKRACRIGRTKKLFSSSKIWKVKPCISLLYWYWYH